MTECEKLYNLAKNSPKNLKFKDLCRLAECFGWIFKRQEGSHRIYENPKLRPDQGRIMNFQDDKGKAKPYQVRQLLKAIERLDDE